MCREQSGRELDPELKKVQDENRSRLISQSFRIADALEAEGIKAYGASKMSLLGVLSGQVVELPDFRNIVFIPAVAQRKRNKMLKQLEYFLQSRPYARMWVFTSGERVTLSGVRARISEMHRRLSKLNAEGFMKASGIRIVFRSSELGSVERSGSGEPTFHIHAHAIVDLEKKIPKNEWSRLLSKVRSWWKFHFKDSKQLQQAREACKYCVKPSDLEALTSKELGELHHQLFKLHLVQCLGDFKELRQKLEETKLKLVRKYSEESSHWELVSDWNRYPKRSSSKEHEAQRSNSDGPEDWLVCTLPPSFALSNTAEPIAVVLNHTGQRISENSRIRKLREHCLAAFKPPNAFPS
ncbi:MAG: hypothetical protein Q7Q71_08025 [Verrucomicrobiota bacterium JB023]|nr:hypothetical protein [Verrucomicrobiota bacterium JB023]